MSTLLSVNLNKIALLRNSRETTIPSVVEAAVTCIEAGAQGITVHPRPDISDDRAQQWFIRGAGAVLIGLLFGFWLGRRMYHRRYNGGWT